MAAAFQQSVYVLQGFGVPGEIFQDVPWIVLSYTLFSDGTPNVVGSTAYTITSDGFAQAGSGGTLGFAGILSSPKDYALYGTSAGPLEPSLILPDYTQAALLTQGMMIISLPDAANIGDYVIYNDTTGTLDRMAPGPTCPTGFSFANAVVSQFTQSNSGGGLAVIQVTPVINPIPTNA
jgi:hypothetical protein